MHYHSNYHFRVSYFHEYKADKQLNFFGILTEKREGVCGQEE